MARHKKGCKVNYIVLAGLAVLVGLVSGLVGLVSGLAAGLVDFAVLVGLAGLAVLVGLGVFADCNCKETFQKKHKHKYEVCVECGEGR